MDPAEEKRRKLNALKLSSFDWVKGLDDVWNLSRWDVPELHRKAEGDFSQEIVQLLSRGGVLSPPGMIVSGPGGAGKTHLLSRFCRIALLNGGSFMLADMSAAARGGFLETVLAGMASSLATPVALLEGRTQASLAAEGALAAAGFQVPRDFAGRHTRANPGKLARDLEKVRDKLQASWPREAAEHSDCLRALFLLNSRDASLRKAAMDWLAGGPPDPGTAECAGFRAPRGDAARAVAGLSFFLSLSGRFSVLALDQMDHLSALFSLIARAGASEAAAGLAAEARARVADFSDGLGRLTGLTRRTLAVVSCLPATWENLSSLSLNTSLERYRRPPVFLSPVGSPEIAARLVAARMKTPCRRAGISPPWPSWPFREESFEDAVGLFPRALMERCHLLVRERVLAGDPSEIRSLDLRSGAVGALEDAAPPPFAASYVEDDLVEAGPASGESGVPGPVAVKAQGPPPGTWPPPEPLAEAPSPLQERDPGDTMVFAWSGDDFRDYLSGSLPDLAGLSDIESALEGEPASHPPAELSGREDGADAFPEGGAAAGFPIGGGGDGAEEAGSGAGHGAPEAGPGGGGAGQEDGDPVFRAEGRFQELFGAADTGAFQDESLEDELWPEILSCFLGAFADSLSGKDRPSVSIEGPPPGEVPPPYHVLVRAEGPGLPEEGRSLYVRALLRNHHMAFASRLRKAMEAASPDRRDPSVRLVLVRFSPKPAGAASAEALESFGACGGLWLRPADSDLALLKAVSELSRELPRDSLLAWMRAFQPWRRLLFLANDLAWLSSDAG
ncbi:MAG: hypothetical protein LBG06_07035 [Deltaproteobacteria bacterium]|jgi:hypothetical protein|nr:hypothetical protein [Deltaproteobacteria bacterium]